MGKVVVADRVVTPEGVRPAAVHIEDGRIVAVTDPSEAGRSPEVVDGWLLPGLVDVHVHCNEPGRTAWEGFASATRAAAAGGVTTIVDMPLNSIPATTTVAALEEKRRAAAGACAVDLAFWGGAVPGNADQLSALHAAGVRGVKCFLADSGVEEFPPLALDALPEVMATLAGFDGLLLVHAEHPEHVGAVVGDPSRHDSWLASRPAVAEDEAVTAVVAAARMTGCRAHIVHLASASAANLLRQAQRDGVRVTAETCPHYLTLTAEQVPDGATVCKCAPPLRDAANADALWAALTDHTIGLVASDHSPSDPACKPPDFAAAWGGVASIGLGLSVVWTAARERGVTLEDVVDWMAAAPARLAQLDGKGAIAVGCDADLVAFDPDAPWTVQPQDLQFRHAISPYVGRNLRGRVTRTWLRGAPPAPGRGRLLPERAP